MLRENVHPRETTSEMAGGEKSPHNVPQGFWSGQDDGSFKAVHTLIPGLITQICQVTWPGELRLPVELRLLICCPKNREIVLDDPGETKAITRAMKGRQKRKRNTV